MSRSFTLRWLCAPAVLAAGAAAQVSGPDPAVTRPDAANRVVRVFDFESRFDDPSRAEIHPVPRHWSMAQDGMPGAGPRPGFPLYNTAKLDEQAAYSGAGSVRLNTQGGSVSLRLNPGVVPVFPGAEYLVSARVLTRGMEHARAAVRARYLDKSNSPIPGSEAVSELVATDGGGGRGGWRLIAATLPGNVPEAAYLQVDLELLQPREFRAPELPGHQLWENDFPADAWFDDVAVVQLPRVRMSTASAANILRKPERPAVSVAVRDLAGEAVAGEMVLQDAQGRVIDRAERALGTGQAVWDWEPAVAELGWYRATLELRANGVRIGSSYLDFVWLPAAPAVAAGAAAADRSRFVTLIGGFPADPGGGLVAAMADASGSGGVVIPAWWAGQAGPRDAAERLSPLIESFTRQGRQVGVSLPRVPRALAGLAHVEPEEPLELLSGDPALWGPWLLPLLDKFGQSVQHWQIGAVGDPPPRGADAPGRVERLRAAMGRMVPGPVVGVPWPAELPPVGLGSGVGELVVQAPYAVPPAGMRALADSWREAAGPGGPELLLVLETLPRGQFSRLDSAAELVRRAVEAWGAFMPDRGEPPGQRPRARLGVMQPWNWPSPPRERAMPHAELAAWHNLVERLSGRRVVGRVPAGPGIVCYVLGGLDASRTGALVAWREAPGADRAEVAAYLGEGPKTLIDLFGNETPLGAQGSPPVHRFAVTDRPVFVEGVDAELARFVASFRVEPGAVPATGDEHDVALVLSNPFQRRIDGRLTILEPGGLSAGPGARDRSWSITPRAATFSMAPGQDARIPIVVAFSPVEEAGPKDVIVEVELAAERAYAPIRLKSTLEVRMNDLELNLLYQRSPDPSGPDLVLEAQVTNRGSTPATMEVTANATGFARMRASIADLAPGDTVTRRFSLPGGAAKLRGDRVTVGVQDVESKARINRSIVIE